MNKLVRLIIKLSPILIPIVKSQLEKRAQQQRNNPTQQANNK
ncbi:hypothetical protein [Macrococcoides caseolyticum]|nr:hypothetical protein [Macrococcus caseolyticus]